MLDTILEWLGFLFLCAVSVTTVWWIETANWDAWWKIALAYIAIAIMAWWRADRDTSREYWWKD